MGKRIDYDAIAPQALKGLIEIEKYNRSADIEFRLYELVKIRASQINGCGYCLNMHHKDAVKGGESAHRLATLSAWRETDFFSEREQAALALTEEMTLISNHGVSDEVYENAKKHFTDKELVDLSMIIVAINGWNRMAIAFKKLPEK